MPLLPTGSELINPFRILAETQIKEGFTVADLGCGAIGHYVFPAAEMVGKDGKVYAVDILQSVLSAIQSRANTEGFVQVKPVWGDIERPGGVPIPDGSVDVVLVINNLFLAKQKIILAQEAYRMTKSGGILTVIDWKQTNIPLGPKPQERVSPESAQEFFIKADFRFDHSFDAGPYHYGLLFTKP